VKSETPLACKKVARLTIFGAVSNQGSVNEYGGVLYLKVRPASKSTSSLDDIRVKRIAQLVTVLRSLDLCDGEVVILSIERIFRVHVGRSA
jgi:hypothetical protein